MNMKGISKLIFVVQVFLQSVITIVSVNFYRPGKARMPRTATMTGNEDTTVDHHKLPAYQNVSGQHVLSL